MGTWNWDEASWVNLKQRDKEKKEKVGGGKYPRRERRTRELSGVTCGREAGLRPECPGRSWAERAGNWGGENLSSCVPARGPGGGRRRNEAWGAAPSLPGAAGPEPHQPELERTEGWRAHGSGSYIHHLER